MERPLLMIPGPVELSPSVAAAAALPPPSHLDPSFLGDFGRALEGIRTLWGATAEHTPFVVPGGGTLAMEAAATNLVGPGDPVVVVSTGYFGERMAEMLRRRGAAVTRLEADPGHAPRLDDVGEAVARVRPVAVFVTHVDTSTGVRVDPEPLARLARDAGALSVFDGVCATAAETFRQAAWGADVYLTASQKALGLPPGLALMVVSPAALERRRRVASPPPLTLDWLAWQPVMEAALEGRGAYFSTPATSLIRALRASVDELLAEGVEAVTARHAEVATRFRAAWSALGLAPLPAEGLAANSLSALWCLEAPALVPAVARRGVAIAGGLHPAIRTRYVRVGHMGWVTTRPELCRRAVAAIADGLIEIGRPVDRDAALDVFAM